MEGSWLGRGYCGLIDHKGRPKDPRIVSRDKESAPTSVTLRAHAAADKASPTNVRSWHKADIATVLNDVCFRG